MNKIYTFLLPIIFCFILLEIPYAHSQVGIGTNTPNSGAVLDLTSNNKGLLLPRVNDTTDVASPSEGLVIFNKNTKTPYFHNGNAWSQMAPMMMGSPSDTITYTMVAPFGVSTQLAGTSISYGFSTPVSSFSFNFSKPTDVNSSALFQGALTEVDLTSIEFKFTKKGGTAPYKSVKFYNVSIFAGAGGFAVPGGLQEESYSGSCLKFGYKDAFNTTGFSVVLSSGVIGSY